MNDSPLYRTNCYPNNSTKVKPQSSEPLREVAKQVAPPQTTQSPPSPVRQSTRSPNRGLRQSPTPRQTIQLEKTNSKKSMLRFGG